MAVKTDDTLNSTRLFDEHPTRTHTPSQKSWPAPLLPRSAPPGPSQHRACRSTGAGGLPSLAKTHSTSLDSDSRPRNVDDNANKGQSQPTAAPYGHAHKKTPLPAVARATPLVPVYNKDSPPLSPIFVAYPTGISLSRVYSGKVP